MAIPQMDALGYLALPQSGRYSFQITLVEAFASRLCPPGDGIGLRAAKARRHAISFLFKPTGFRLAPE